MDVVKVLLSGDIDLDLRDSGDKTVLDVMEDIKTPVSLEITDVIIGTSYLGWTRESADAGLSSFSIQI